MSPKGKQAKPFSLRLRLLILVVVLLVVSLSLVGFALDAAFHKSNEAGLQARMESLVYLVLAATEVTDDGVLRVDDDPGDPRLGQPGSAIYAVVEQDGQHWASPSSLGTELPELAAVEPGGSVFTLPAEGRRFYTLQYGVSWELADGQMLPVTVSVIVRPREIRQEKNAFRLGLWRSLGATALVLAIAQLFILALGLRPLQRITQDISAIESGELERLEGHYATELEPLKRNLNRLLDTEKANQTRYRNALDSLAHSLKTPLSVIRSSLPADTPSKADVVQNAVSDMQRLIATRLQRAAITTRRSIAQAVSVRGQAERLAQSLERVYSQKMINIELNIEHGLDFYGEQRDLLELAGNLLDNACKYGNGEVRLTARPLDAATPRTGMTLEVEDNGPGIAEQARDQLLQRGVRGDERVDGHGLGLAIVLEIVSAYNGEISIGASELGGARVSVTLKP
ncbi:MAG: ATP-binding protein [Xanthomonadales bacterium]|nr:ATP-binding protein [Xanthomonadales bacterium]